MPVPVTPPRHYRNYTDEDIKRLVPTVISMRQLLIALKLKPKGGNFQTLKMAVHRLSLDTSHWLGKAACRGQFQEWDSYRCPSAVRHRVIQEDGYKCLLCGIDSWLKKPISLELDHIDGDNTNHSRNNLRLLCPNCHSQTPTFRNRKRVLV